MNEGGRAVDQSMIRKSGSRFSEKIMLRQSMIRKSGSRFSEKIMLRQKVRALSIQSKAIAL
jgi:hypothetical protein